MLIFDLRTIGNNLLQARKRTGLTQAEVAEAAGMSDRAYADIERGSVNMRTETFLRICSVLHVTPDEILTEDVSPSIPIENQVLAQLANCSPQERNTALQLLSVYLNSL